MRKFLSNLNRYGVDIILVGTVFSTVIAAWFTYVGAHA